jgi:hypothetical protein
MSTSTFALHGDNVTDEEYLTTGIGGWGAPATAGVSIRAKSEG